MKVRTCPLAQKHHKESCRQFAHVFHKRDTICVTPEFRELPQLYQIGILLHEFGHVKLKGQSHSEQDADDAVFDMLGIVITRRTYRGMKNLERITEREKDTALRFLYNNIDA